LDEAGSRVRLENKRLPQGVLLLLKELQQTLSEKDKAIRQQDFETASNLLEYEMEVRTQILIMKQALEINEKTGLKRVNIDMVMEDDVAEVIAGWTGIPVNKISESESIKLLNMEQTLHERLIGQHQAIVAVSKAIRRARVGLRNPDRPIASFIFAGPTGVGKTELTKALAAYMFGTEDTMVRLDMSEYMEKHTVAKLIGSPPGYVGYSEGGQLTEAVRGKPYTVVLFDEIEKAHPDVFNLLLQILDDGRLTDSKGRTVNFKNTLIILTSNVGAKIIEKESGIQSKKSNQSYFDINANFLTSNDSSDLDDELYKRISTLVNEELKKYFRPEFLNRLDEIIIFRHLTRNDITQISEIMIKQLKDRMKEKEIELEIKQIVKTMLIDQGYDPIYGARPLRRAVMRLLEDNLAQQCLSKPLYPRTKLIVDADLYDNIIVEVDYTAVDPDLKNKDKKLNDNTSK
ncbi:MAG TPA: AAA family ATPase, partial [Allocoleopsis sp.]